MSTFEYQNAFSRNIGWLTPDEQLHLKNRRVAVAGCGGVGAEYIVALARAGFQNFNIADFDEYEVHNFNRQAGAFMSTVGQDKSKVMEQVALDINPQSDIKRFDDGVNKDNIDAFLHDVDVYVDGLDFFALEARLLVYKYCQDKGIPVFIAAPIGMGTAMLNFLPGSMSYDDYFNFSSVDSLEEKLVLFMIGLSPSLIQLKYLVYPEGANFSQQKTPSTIIGVKLCAGVVASNVLKHVLKRGKIIAAPRAMHFDAYLNTLKHTHCRFGNKGLLQRLKYAIAKKRLV
ncbi:ThiF family adenylyltransferase [Glaciecola siphonariae]|uniref:ThiF family adenylyltransferase n=1 Tax=Glaciecola siphonariae TaxID=521012 RepID=A0ABV9LUE0_9ALTE